jgi:hypothetical protein
MIYFVARIPLKLEDVAPMYDFLLHCNDEQYQAWWSGTHLAFHTTRGIPGAVGSELYFDEYVGTMRLRFGAKVIRAETNREIVWHLKKVVPLPAWLSMRFERGDSSAEFVHTLSAGWRGAASTLLDPLIRLYLNKRFEAQLYEHAMTEFPMLAGMLRSGDAAHK